MKSLILSFNLTIMLLLKGFLCAEISDVPATQESVEHIASSKSPSIKFDPSVFKKCFRIIEAECNSSCSYTSSSEDEIRLLNNPDKDFSSSNADSKEEEEYNFTDSSSEDLYHSSNSSIGAASCSSEKSTKTESRSSNISKADDFFSDKSSNVNVSATCQNLIKDIPCSLNHSVESIFSSYKKMIKDVSCPYSSSDDSNEKVEDDLALVKDFSFEKSTLIYLMAILDKLKNDSNEVFSSFDRDEILGFIDDSINLIDTFKKVLRFKKNDITVILKDKMNKINSNFNSLETTLLEMDKIIDGFMSNNEKSKLKPMFKNCKKLKSRFDIVKEVFEKHKVRWEQIGDFDSNKKIKIFNEYKDNFNELQAFIYDNDEEDIQNITDDFYGDFYKNMLDFLKHSKETLKTEYNLLTHDFSILNDLLKW